MEFWWPWALKTPEYRSNSLDFGSMIIGKPSPGGPARNAKATG